MTGTAIYPSLRRKRVVITGGGLGIGTGLVAGFVGQGARVVFVDLAENASLASIETLRLDAEQVPAFHRRDLTDFGTVAQTTRAIEAEVGGVEVLVNNADRHTPEAVTPAYWDDRMAVNLRHLFFCAQAVIPCMKTRGTGVILNFGSISWHLGLEDLVIYQTAKAAIEGLTRALAPDLGPPGVRVNTIVPGNVQTPRQEKWYTPEGEAEIVAAPCLKARVQPSDIAAMTMFLVSDDAPLCTFHHYCVDAGWR